MAKIKTQYSCQNCGFNTSKWLGRCPACEAWNTLVEERADAAEVSSRRAMRDPGGLRPDWVLLEGTESVSAPQKRLATGIGELDRVLGGGLVPDSFVLLGGEPGIGKSTLLLQMVQGLLSKNENLKILYASGEESIDQIRGRAHRLGVKGLDRAYLAAETQLEGVFATVKEIKPDVLLMDSLQTFASSELESAPGSVGQVREITARLMNLAKSEGISVWLVGHVTKEGSIAGPKAVEHMVDTVLYFETESGQSYRLLRAVKNRFGSSRELGVFEMDGEGLREVSNPSSLFLSDRKEAVSGTAISATLEGSRPLLVELQALVASTALAVPRRTSVGMDSARIALIAAILEKHMKLPLAEEDLFFNVAGGLRLTEPACDLAAAAAIWSSFEEKPLPTGWVLIGEVGLTGEVRRVSQADIRIEEARKLGFSTIVIPRSAYERAQAQLGKNASSIKLLPLSTISELPDLLKLK
ncbi:MAG: DNA repair protein RadA [Oligoflexia bacterium]|nr:DNA repair protein RadA [Oligoflexia bacterium]